MEVKGKENKFKFKCKKCGFCCQFTIILYPFDIINLCEHLEIKTKEFLEKYAVLKVDKDGILRCLLKKDIKCILNKNNLCSVYEARPIRCRLFPIGRYFEKETVYYLLPNKKCIGFESKKRQSVGEWVNEQNVSQYDNMANDWNQFVIKLKNNNFPLKNPKFLTMFTKIFYDFDNELIDKYKQQLDIKNNEDFMKLLYQIAEETLLSV